MRIKCSMNCLSETNPPKRNKFGYQGACTDPTTDLETMLKNLVDLYLDYYGVKKRVTSECLEKNKL